MKPLDEDLRHLFDEARRADEKSAPSFRSVLKREPASRSAPLRIGRALVAAAAVVIFAVAVKLVHRPPETTASRIESWKAPTDFLLEASFTNLFDTTPALPGGVPDYSPLLTKENQKGKKS